MGNPSNSFVSDRTPASVIPDRLILFVHGLGGDAKGSWGLFPELLLKDVELGRVTVGHFTYPTSLFRMPFSRRCPKVQTLAAALQTQIDNRFERFQDITLVCHSLGGLIGRQYLINQVELNRRLRVRRILLYAVPNNGAGLASIAVYVSWRHGQLKQLCKDSDLVRSISQDWVRCKVADRVHTRYVVAALDDVVSEYSAYESWGNDSVEVVADRGHINVIKPIDSTDISFLILKRFLIAKSNLDSSSTERESHTVPASRRQTPGPVERPSTDAPQPLPDRELRVAFSALLRIDQGDRYLLVQNIHRPESFGPFGGVYKYSDRARSELDKLAFRPQVIADEMLNDIRGFLPSSFLSDFIKWFDKADTRESCLECLRRELKEECGEVGIAELPILNSVRFRHIRTVKEGPEDVPGQNYIQFRIFEVYDLADDMDESRICRKALADYSRTCASLLWVTSREIIKGRASGGQVIGHHAAYLIGEKRYRPDDPPFD